MLKVWVGSSQAESDVYLFLRPPKMWVRGWNETGYWREDNGGCLFSRAFASKHFLMLPAHGTDALIEYDMQVTGFKEVEKVA